jgi:hypothetical protein
MTGQRHKHQRMQRHRYQKEAAKRETAPPAMRDTPGRHLTQNRVQGHERS